MVCADYKQAEVATIAYLSGDPTLIAAVESGEDVHSVAAIEMFKLDCTVKEVKKKYKHLRVAAKSIRVATNMLISDQFHVWKDGRLKIAEKFGNPTSETGESEVKAEGNAQPAAETSE